MPQWKPIVGLSFDPTSFDVYVKALAFPTWRPSFIALHNTAVPNLAQRPNGFTRQHIDNLVGYYRDKQGWSAGPHLFVDDRQIWVFTPLTTTGRHSPSWNALAWGVEMLGDYDHDDPSTGRGAKVYANTICALASLSGAMGLDPSTLRLHKEDRKTNHDCPGRNIRKERVIADVTAAMDRHYGLDHDPRSPHPE